MLIILKPESVDQIIRQYPQKWVLISNPVWGSDGLLASGTVLCAEEDERDVYAMLRGQPFRNVVIWNTADSVPQELNRLAVPV
jgi:hypothetical protein